MNPKGFFELQSQEKFLGRVFKEYYPGPTAPPATEVVAEICKRNIKVYKKYLCREFKGESKIAIKAPRWLPLPFYELLSKELDIRVLSLTRDINKQVVSTFRVWQQTYDPILVGAKKEQIRKWIISWQEFGKRMRLRCENTLPIYDLSFEELIADPVMHSKMLFRWLNIPAPHEDSLRMWFDNSLVNRYSLPSITKMEAVKRGLKRRLLNIIQKPYKHYSPHIVREPSSEKSN